MRGNLPGSRVTTNLHDAVMLVWQEAVRPPVRNLVRRLDEGRITAMGLGVGQDVQAIDDVWRASVIPLLQRVIAAQQAMSALRRWLLAALPCSGEEGAGRGRNLQ